MYLNVDFHFWTSSSLAGSVADCDLHEPIIISRRQAGVEAGRKRRQQERRQYPHSKAGISLTARDIAVACLITTALGMSLAPKNNV